MARILKFDHSHGRGRARLGRTIRPQTLTLLMALVFLIALNLLRGDWVAAPITGAPPPAPPGAWMESAYADRFTDDRPAQSPGVSYVESGTAPSAEQLPRIYRGSAAKPDTVAVMEATVRTSFGLCHGGGGFNCVVDGDTIWLRGDKIRIADIDAPETHPSRCAAEASKGAAATRRLQTLLSAGPFALESIDRDQDRYGRKLRVLTRGGESIGGMLVSEGLARWYGDGRQAWC